MATNGSRLFENSKYSNGQCSTKPSSPVHLDKIDPLKDYEGNVSNHNSDHVLFFPFVNNILLSYNHS